jgi:hypothetical protein
MIFTPRGLPCKTDEIRTGDTVMGKRSVKSACR